MKGSFMARPKKEGLDYFELDCQMDDKIKLIQAEFGLKGFAIVVKLFQLIYGGHGYYGEFDRDRLLLFATNNGLSVSTGEGDKFIMQVVNACMKRGIFSKDLYDQYSILTSSGIQKRYISAVSKREQVEMEKGYLLICGVPKYIKVVEKLVSGAGNPVSSSDNTQSRVEKSREENIINIEHSAKPKAPTRRKYGEYKHVLLSDADKEKLYQEFGESKTNMAIKFLDEYMEKSGKRYKNFVLVLKGWPMERVEQSINRQPKDKQSIPGNRFDNFTPREEQHNINDQMLSKTLKKLEGGT